MIIDEVSLSADLETILTELIKQMRLNGIPYMQKTINTPSDIQVCCPYHKDGMEKKPSAGIRKEDGLLHCFACGETHGLPEVISHCFGHNDAGAFGWKWLLKNYATVSVEERKDVRLDLERNKGRWKCRGVDSRSVIGTDSDSNSVKCSDRYVSEEELDRYRYYHPYWGERGITDENIIEMFDLGYDIATQTITFPVKDSSGHCVCVARRSVKTKWFNYPKGTEKPLYGLYELYSLEKFPSEVYVTESMIDTLLLWQHGKYAVALNGLGTDLQFEQLRKLPCRKLILATDADEAGQSARRKIRYKIRNKIITEVVIPKGKKDIGDCTGEEIENLLEIF